VGIQAHQEAQVHCAQDRLAPKQCAPCNCFQRLQGRVFGAHIKGVDKSTPKTPFGDKYPFGEPLVEIECGGWVQSVKWSPSGNLLAFAGHDSSFNVADVSSGQARTSVVKFEDLPLQDIIFVNEGSVVGVGHDCTPVLFSNQGGWKLAKKIDTGGSAPTGAATKQNSAMDMFKNKVDRAESSSETKLTTKHQNAINCVQKYKNEGYSTSGLDGQLIVWGMP